MRPLFSATPSSRTISLNEAGVYRVISYVISNRGDCVYDPRSRNPRISKHAQERQIGWRTQLGQRIQGSHVVLLVFGFELRPQGP